MGSQPIRIQLGKILREILAGKSCGKILWEILREILAGKSCGKSCGKILWEILWENLVGNLVEKSCRKILWENLGGQGGGEKVNLRKTVIGGNLAFGVG